MKNSAKYVTVLLFFLVSCSNRDITSSTPQYRYSNIYEPIQIIDRGLPPLFVQDSKSAHLYLLNTMTNSYSIELLPDSSYVYCGYYELLNEISVGAYSIQGNLYTLSWDSVRTAEAIKDSTTYEKYYFYYKTIANKIEGVSLSLEIDTLKLEK